MLAATGAGVGSFAAAETKSAHRREQGTTGNRIYTIANSVKLMDGLLVVASALLYVRIRRFNFILDGLDISIGDDDTVVVAKHVQVLLECRNRDFLLPSTFSYVIETIM